MNHRCTLMNPCIVFGCIVLAMGAWLVGCSDDPASPALEDEPEATEIGPDGGTATDSDGYVEVIFPAGAVTSATEITIGAAASPPPNAGMIATRSYDFGPDGSQFAQPVTLRIGFEATQIPAGVSANDLRLCKVVGGVWETVSGSIVDTTRNEVEGLVTSFSTYGVGRPQEGEGPTITVQPPTITLPLYGTAQFRVDVQGLEDTAVVWSIREGEIGGRIRDGGLYNAWYSAGVFHIIATSVANPEIFGEAEVTISTEWECPDLPPEEPYELVWTTPTPDWQEGWSHYPVSAIAWTPQGLRVGAEYCVQYWSLTGEFVGWSGLGFYDVIGDGLAGHETHVGYHAGVDPLDVPIPGEQSGAFVAVPIPVSDGLGNLYVYDGHGRITVLDHSGAPTTSWEGIVADGISLGPDRKLYVVGRGPGADYALHRYSLQGQWLDSLLEIGGEPYYDNASSSRHLAGFDQEGRFYWPFGYGEWVVGILSPDFEYIGSIVKRGQDACEASPGPTVVDPDGNVFLVGFNVDSEPCFKKFDRNGWLLAQWPTEGFRPRGMALDSENNIFAAGMNADGVGFSIKMYRAPNR